MDSLVEKVQKRLGDAPNIQAFASLVYIIQETGSHINRHISYVSTIDFFILDYDFKNTNTNCWIDCSHDCRNIADH
jgi:hypothetical protein